MLLVRSRTPQRSPVKDKQEISLVEKCQNQQLIYWIIDTIVIVVFFSTLSFLSRRDAAVKIFVLVLTTKKGRKKLSKLRVNVNLLWWVEEDDYDDGRHCRLIDERDILSILMRKSSAEWENLWAALLGVPSANNKQQLNAFNLSGFLILGIFSSKSLNFSTSSCQQLTAVEIKFSHYLCVGFWELITLCCDDD